MKKGWLMTAVIILSAPPAHGMLRVLKYRPLTEVQDQQICVYAKHEKNRNPDHQFHPQNTRDPIVCRLKILGEAWPQKGSVAQSRTLAASVVQKFEFGTLTKACVSFAKDLPEGYRIKDFAGMNTECATAEAAPRVFSVNKG
ncbi:hypothetical protein [Oligoflexus tunisiensis]|uniref:hypothetical protein n=1 Tax=Oligoflexus tunisiensis TaxID=708132 RepID=UPI00114D2CD6|nr:hypothetical protein [Oligoflexus tunisiensis]